MKERTPYDRAVLGTNSARIRTSLNLTEVTELALRLYALTMPIYQGRSRSVSIANEHVLYKDAAFLELIPVAEKLIEKGEADQIKVYRVGEEQEAKSRALIDNAKRELQNDQSKERGGASR